VPERVARILGKEVLLIGDVVGHALRQMPHRAVLFEQEMSETPTHLPLCAIQP
jgi:hypothetical protein